MNSYIPNFDKMVSQWPVIRDTINNCIRQGSSSPTVHTYSAIVTGTTDATYYGGVLAPNNRLYLVPHNLTTLTQWHYIDINTGAVVAYSHLAGTFPAYAYRGGVLAPNARIYLMPNSQVTATQWHYIDTTKAPGSTGHVTAYSHATGLTAGNTCIGGVLDTNGRIYLVPYGMATNPRWYYINTNTGAVVAYSHFVTVIYNGYAGGILAPNGKIYLLPSNQCTQPQWHYIDPSITPGSAGHVVAYSHGAGTLPAYAYLGGILAPNGRIYLIPLMQATAPQWHYIDTNTGAVVAYSHNMGTLIAQAYAGGTLAPDGKIYLTPYAQSTYTQWHYIDTTKTPGSAGHVVAYSHGIVASINTASFAYLSGILANNGRIYMIPFKQGSSTTWHYIETNCNENWSKNLCLSPYYDKF